MSESDKPNCKYGANCYRKNPDHIANFQHPPKEEIQSVEHSEDLPEEEKSTEQAKAKKRKLWSPKKDATKLNVGKDSSSDIEEGQEKDAHEEKSEVKAASSSKDDYPKKELCTEYEKKEVMKLASQNFFVDLEKKLYNSYLDEYKEMVKSRETFIRNKFLVQMPDDFYLFWEFCKSIAKSNKKPENVFEAYGIKLVGPFDVLAGKFDNAEMKEPADYLRHWRFYYDPPEFQTTFVKEKTCIHYGYWRDDLSETDCLLMAKNDSQKNCEFEFVGANCFETILYALDHDAVVSPFNRGSLTNLKKQIQDFAKEKEVKLSNFAAVKAKRDRKVVCKTFHKAGIVVPFDRKTELGYRNLIETDAGLKKILKKFELAEGDKDILDAAMESLQPVITAANIAVDECDFGTSIELGIDLFCSGIEYLHDVVRLLLVNGYSLLQRPQFIAILKSHLEKRIKGDNLSVIS